MKRKAKQIETETLQTFKGSALKQAKTVFKDAEYWVAQTVLDDDTYYTIPQARLIVKQEMEKGV